MADLSICNDLEANKKSKPPEIDVLSGSKDVRMIDTEKYSMVARYVNNHCEFTAL